MSTALMITSARSATRMVLGLLAGLYAAQSVTGSMVQTALPTVLREEGMSLEQIGYLAVLFLPWALKFLWSPLVDRFLDERRWILLCQAGIVACFAMMIALPPQTQMTGLAIVLFLMAALAATQDVATDALAVKASTEATRGIAAGASTAGAYLGFLVGGGLWLVVYSHAGWAISMAAMAGFVALLTVPVFLAGGLVQAKPAAASGKRGPGLRATFSNRRLMVGLIFLVVYQIGIRMGSSLTGPYLVDKGLALDAIGAIRGAGGAIAGFIASMFGAILCQKIGITRAIVTAALINGALLVALAAFEFSDSASQTTAIVLLVAQVAAVALSFVALYAAMMNWCAPGQTATDYAFLQSLDAILAIAASSVAGLLGNAFGYGWLFAASAAFIAAALSMTSRTLGGSAPPQSTSKLTEKVSQP